MTYHRNVETETFAPRDPAVYTGPAPPHGLNMTRTLDWLSSPPHPQQAERQHTDREIG